VTVLDTVLLTTRVNAEKVAVVAPASTVTEGGSVTGSLPESVMTAPPVGAAAERVAVPMIESPPTTLALGKVIETSAARAVTVSDAD
jgi:hypothetical protein